MKLEHRLAILTAVITAGTTATCLATAFLLVRHSAMSELDEFVIDGAKAAAVVVSHLEEEAEREASPQPLSIPDDVALIVQRISVYSSSGQRIASRPEAVDVPERLPELLKLPGAKTNQPFDLDLPQGPMRAILISNRSLAGKSVLHAVSRTHVDKKINQRAQIFTSLFWGSLALVVFASRWLGRRLASDVNQITVVARRVANGELSARAGTVGLTSPETRNLAHELNHMIAELAALMASQRSFISNAAHELRSPLAALQGELQLALRRPRTEEAYVETLGNALSEVAALTQLAEDLLTLARAQSDSSATEHAQLEDIIDDAIRLVQGSAQIQETVIEVNAVDIELLMVVGRRRDLARLLRNLLENAIKFGPRGGKVKVIAHRDGEYVSLFVEDGGPGISVKERTQLFEPFFRASSQVTGTGLGLAIAREIARKSGGDIGIDETYRHGTRLRVTLRISQGEAVCSPESVKHQEGCAGFHE
jgi:signal transduction histidine kinase